MQAADPFRPLPAKGGMKQKGKPKPIQAAALHFGGDAFRRAQQGHAGDVAIFKDKPEDCNSLYSFIFLREIPIAIGTQ